MQISEEQAHQRALLDAGIFIGALLKGAPRHQEARSLVERARLGELAACTTPGILSEVYGALTWEKAQPRHPPVQAASAVRLLVEPPSAIDVLEENLAVILRTLELAASHNLTARRVHDARHAAAALAAGIQEVYSYDVNDWRLFEADGLKVVEPESALARTKTVPALNSPSS
jgi:predicted nucleic acid-binding protein